MYRIVKYDDGMHDAWETCLTASRNGNFLCSRKYLQYHASRFQDESVLVEREGKTIAIFPCTGHGDSIISHGGLTYAGLIYPMKTQAADVMGGFKALCEAFALKGFARMVYKAVPHVFQRYPSDEDLYALHALGARILRRDLSSVIKVASCPAFSDSRKNTIRKAAKDGATVRETDDLASYHRILSDVLLRHGSTPTHSLDELAYLYQAMSGRIRLLGSYKDGEMIAGVLAYDFGQIVHTQYMANSEHGRKIGALDQILAEMIQSIFKDREYISFGISTTDEGRVVNSGLLNQKEGFGGRAIVHDFYELDLTKIPRGATAANDGR